MDSEEFRKKLLKIHRKRRISKVTNSNGTKEAWRWIKKNKWLNIGQPITEREFGLIVKAINLDIQDRLLKGEDVVLPKRMGRLEIRKGNPTIEIKDGKIVTNLPIDWKSTTELWYEDNEAYKNKKLVRFESFETFIIYYNKEFANYENKSFYKFMPTRTFKIRLKNEIINKGFDALLLKSKNEVYKYKSNNGQAH